jgi:hypothetical protein
MAIGDIAQAAVAIFPPNLQVTMVAIAGAETGGSYNASAGGDCGLGGPACGRCDDGADGATSWGAWQIHNSHADYLAGQTGSVAPCAWRSWLSNPLNCARAALYLLQSPPGLDNWTTFTSGAYKAYLAQAQAAVAAARGGSGSAPSPARSWQLWVAAGGIVTGSVAIALAVDPALRQEAIDAATRVRALVPRAL